MKGDFAVTDPNHIAKVGCFATKERTNPAEQNLVLARLLDESITLPAATGGVTIEDHSIHAVKDVFLKMA